MKHQNRTLSKSLSKTINPFKAGSRLASSVLILGLSAILLTVSAFNPLAFSSLRMELSDMLSPALKTIAAPIQNTALLVRDISGIAELQAENARLTGENIRLKEWYQKALLLESENQSLRELMDFKLPAQHTYITSTLLSDAGQKFVKSILLTSGNQDGVKKGQAVISSEGLIGRVIETGSRTSRVLLATDHNSRIPVLLENSQQHAVMAGQNNKTPLLTHLPDGAAPSIGTRVITSGRGGVFPYGLPVGHIVASDTGEVTIHLHADTQKALHVRIIKSPKDPNHKAGTLAIQ